MQNLHNLPKDNYFEFKEAFEQGNWLFLIAIWNQYHVTDSKLCAGCPSSIDIVEKGFEKWLRITGEEME